MEEEEEDVRLAKEGNMKEVTEETAIEFPDKESIYLLLLLLLPLKRFTRMWFSLPQLRRFEGYPLSNTSFFLIDEINICRKPT